MASILNVDKIRRAAGSTDALVIDSGDRITTPARPAFNVRHTSGSTVGITGTIIFDTEDFDIGANYDTSNGRFTAPVAGIYYFSFDSLPCENTSGSALAAASAVWFQFRKNGAEVIATSQRGYAYAASTNQFNTVNRVEIMQLSANDYIQVYVGSKYVYNDASGVYCPTFHGHLIG